MSASQAEKSKLTDIKKLGIIAGGGKLPFMLVDACRKQGIEPYILAFKNHTEPDLVEDVEHVWTALGALQKNIDLLKAQNIHDLVFCGYIKRPSLIELKPDIRATKFFAKNSLKAMGDNDLLTAVKGEIAKDGFKMHGVHAFIDDILTPKGVLGSVKPRKVHMSDINYGFNASQEVGRLDIGQAVIVQDGIVIAVEGVEGTDNLINRSKKLLKTSDNKGVLIKTCKPQQDKDLDLPTIGEQTIIQAHEAGLAGVAVHADNSLILDCDTVIKKADKLGLFLYGAEK